MTAFPECLPVIESLQDAQNAPQVVADIQDVDTGRRQSLLEAPRPTTGEHRLAGQRQRLVNSFAMPIVRNPVDQSLALQYRQRLRDRAAGRAEIGGHGDGDIAVAIGLSEIAQHLQVHRQQPVPGSILPHQLVDQRGQTFENKDGWRHATNVSPRSIS